MPVPLCWALLRARLAVSGVMGHAEEASFKARPWALVATCPRRVAPHLYQPPLHANFVVSGSWRGDELQSQAMGRCA